LGRRAVALCLRRSSGMLDIQTSPQTYMPHLNHPRIGRGAVLLLPCFSPPDAPPPPLAPRGTTSTAATWSAPTSALGTLPSNKTDKILVLMERGMIRHARQEYNASVRDWLDAADLGEQLDYYSLSRGSASLAVNDSVMAFHGAPYERTLLYAFAPRVSSPCPCGTMPPPPPAT